MHYEILKFTHVSCVLISGCGFLVRSLWMLHGSALLRRRWLRIVPHVVDTALLASAIGLVVLSRQYPWTHSWILAKILGLLLYIGLGMAALRFGRTKAIRGASASAALLAFAYIVSVALTRDSWGAMRLL